MGPLFLLPFDYQKSWVDQLAVDGTVESYTLGIHTSIQYCAGPLAVLFFGFIVFLTGFKGRANSLIRSAALSSVKNLSLRRVEIKELFNKISPSKDDAIPLMVLAGIIILGAFFRYAYLWRPMGHDETYTFMAFASRGLRFVISDYHLPNNHVFHTVLVNFAYHLYGDSPAVVRLPAFLAGVLIIPATYLVGRVFYWTTISLVSASIVASLPVLIDYSTTARGYTFLALFTLIIIALAAYNKDHKNLVGWVVFAVFSAFGLYTLPTMIYPIGMVITWLLLSGIINDVSINYGRRFYLYLIIISILILLFTTFLYSPIIINSGIQSLVGNDVVGSLSWSEFTQSVPVRIKNTWAEWNRDIPVFISLLALLGLGVSIIYPKYPRNRRIPLIAAGLLWIGTALIIQKVAPWPRIWLFLLPLFIIWISAGLIGLTDLFFKRIPNRPNIQTGMITILILLPLVAGFGRSYTQYSQKMRSKGEPEEIVYLLKDFLNPAFLVIQYSI